MEKYEKGRDFLKTTHWRQLYTEKTDQQQGVEKPAVQKPPDGDRTDLPPMDQVELANTPLVQIIKQRRSRRAFSDAFLGLDELSFLLWATQGVRDQNPTFRTVPSAGARHTFETYLYVDRVDTLAKGLYRYLPTHHQLTLLRQDDHLASALVEACFYQDFVGQGAVTFIWTSIPYRMEWRYSTASHKLIALDAGHLCQNLYLASESIGAGTCAIGAYDQEAIDQFIGVNGVNEFVVYLAPVGRIAPS